MEPPTTNVWDSVLRGTDPLTLALPPDHIEWLLLGPGVNKAFLDPDVRSVSFHVSHTHLGLGGAYVDSLDVRSLPDVYLKGFSVAVRHILADESINVEWLISFVATLPVDRVRVTLPRGLAGDDGNAVPAAPPLQATHATVVIRGRGSATAANWEVGRDNRPLDVEVGDLCDFAAEAAAWPEADRLLLLHACQVRLGFLFKELKPLAACASLVGALSWTGRARRRRPRATTSLPKHAWGSPRLVFIDGEEKMISLLGPVYAHRFREQSTRILAGQLAPIAERHGVTDYERAFGEGCAGFWRQWTELQVGHLELLAKTVSNLCFVLAAGDWVHGMLAKRQLSEARLDVFRTPKFAGANAERLVFEKWRVFFMDRVGDNYQRTLRQYNSHVANLRRRFFGEFAHPRGSETWLFGRRLGLARPSEAFFAALPEDALADLYKETVNARVLISLIYDIVFHAAVEPMKAVEFWNRYHSLMSNAIARYVSASNETYTASVEALCYMDWVAGKLPSTQSGQCRAIGDALWRIVTSTWTRQTAEIIRASAEDLIVRGERWSEVTNQLGPPVETITNGVVPWSDLLFWPIATAAKGAHDTADVDAHYKKIIKAHVATLNNSKVDVYEQIRRFLLTAGADPLGRVASNLEPVNGMTYDAQVARFSAEAASNYDTLPWVAYNCHLQRKLDPRLWARGERRQFPKPQSHQRPVWLHVKPPSILTEDECKRICRNLVEAGYWAEALQTMINSRFWQQAVNISFEKIDQVRWEEISQLLQQFGHADPRIDELVKSLKDSLTLGEILVDWAWSDTGQNPRPDCDDLKLLFLTPRLRTTASWSATAPSPRGLVYQGMDKLSEGDEWFAPFAEAFLHAWPQPQTDNVAIKIMAIVKCASRSHVRPICMSLAAVFGVLSQPGLQLAPIFEAIAKLEPFVGTSHFDSYTPERWAVILEQGRPDSLVVPDYVPELHGAMFRGLFHKHEYITANYAMQRAIWMFPPPRKSQGDDIIGPMSNSYRLAVVTTAMVELLHLAAHALQTQNEKRLVVLLKMTHVVAEATRFSQEPGYNISALEETWFVGFPSSRILLLFIVVHTDYVAQRARAFANTPDMTTRHRFRRWYLVAEKLVEKYQETFPKAFLEYTFRTVPEEKHYHLVSDSLLQYIGIQVPDEEFEINAMYDKIRANNRQAAMPEPEPEEADPPPAADDQPDRKGLKVTAQTNASEIEAACQQLGALGSGKKTDKEARFEFEKGAIAKYFMEPKSDALDAKFNDPDIALWKGNAAKVRKFVAFHGPNGKYDHVEVAVNVQHIRSSKKPSKRTPDQSFPFVLLAGPCSFLLDPLKNEILTKEDRLDCTLLYNIYPDFSDARQAAEFYPEIFRLVEHRLPGTEGRVHVVDYVVFQSGPGVSGRERFKELYIKIFMLYLRAASELDAIPFITMPAVYFAAIQSGQETDDAKKIFKDALVAAVQSSMLGRFRGVLTGFHSDPNLRIFKYKGDFRRLPLGFKNVAICVNANTLITGNGIQTINGPLEQQIGRTTGPQLIRMFHPGYNERLTKFDDWEYFHPSFAKPFKMKSPRNFSGPSVPVSPIKKLKGLLGFCDVVDREASLVERVLFSDMASASEMYSSCHAEDCPPIRVQWVKFHFPDEKHAVVQVIHNRVPAFSSKYSPQLHGQMCDSIFDAIRVSLRNKRSLCVPWPAKMMQGWTVSERHKHVVELWRMACRVPGLFPGESWVGFHMPEIGDADDFNVACTAAAIGSFVRAVNASLCSMLRAGVSFNVCTVSDERLGVYKNDFFDTVIERATFGAMSQVFLATGGEARKPTFIGYAGNGTSGPGPLFVKMAECYDSIRGEVLGKRNKVLSWKDKAGILEGHMEKYKTLYMVHKDQRDSIQSPKEEIVRCRTRMYYNKELIRDKTNIVKFQGGRADRKSPRPSALPGHHTIMAAEVQLTHDFATGDPLNDYSHCVTLFYNIMPDFSASAARNGLSPDLTEMTKIGLDNGTLVTQDNWATLRDYYTRIVSFYLRVAGLEGKVLFLPIPEAYVKGFGEQAKDARRVFVGAVYRARELALESKSKRRCPGIYLPEGDDDLKDFDGEMPIVRVGPYNALAFEDMLPFMAICVMGNTWVTGSAALNHKIHSMEEQLTRLTGTAIPWQFNAKLNPSLLRPELWQGV